MLLGSLQSSRPDLTVTMSFKGMAVYAYCIIANAVGQGYLAFTNLTFSIDGSQVGTYSHTPDGSGSFLFNTLVYSDTSIPDGFHTLIIRAPVGTNQSLILFDYIEYTFDSSVAPTTFSLPATPTIPSSVPSSVPSSAPSTTSPLSASSKSSTQVDDIVGGVIGGLVILALLGIGI